MDYNPRDNGGGRIRKSERFAPENENQNRGPQKTTQLERARFRAEQRRREASKTTVVKRTYYDFTLIFLIILACGFGLIMLYSVTSYSDAMKASTHYNGAASMLNQLKNAAVGLVALIGLSFFSYRILTVKKGVLVFLFYIFTVALSVYTMYFGVDSHGKKRWVKIWKLPQFQPAELVKIALILVLAYVISKLYRVMQQSLLTSLIVIALTLVAAAPVAKENLSSGIIIVLIGFSMLFASTKHIWPYVVMVVLVVVGAVVAYKTGLLEKVLHDYQMDRVNAWLNPMLYKDNEAYQTVQGLYAIASGGFFGKGLGQSIQKFIIPEVANDMIFTVICEELGLFGVVFVLVLFALMAIRLFYIALHAPDMFGGLIAIGILAHICLQVLMHIAVCISFMPNTGIGLPFISSGGSAVVGLMVEMSLALSISMRIEE